MLRDLAIQYYNPENNYNYSCSEAMLHAIDEYYQMHLPEEMFFAASSYSGGAGHDELCGALASCLFVLGILYSNNGHFHDSEELEKVRAELFSRFEEKFGPYHCVHLKEKYYIPGRKCERLVAYCADILEDIITNNDIINKRN